MILKVNDAQTANVSMILDINYESKYIEVLVKTWNKVNGAHKLKQFRASDFAEALEYFAQEERMWC